jgi:uncharacterized protein YjhX (UPF0386 family)
MNKKKSLSKAQQRALNKLTDKGQCAYELKERISTLEALVKRGYVIVERGLGSMAFPRTSILFRKKE